VRQLAEETLVAVVEMLRALELLYLVNAEVDVPALLDVLIELRQFDDTTELALDPIGRPLRVLFGDTARTEGFDRWSHCSGGAGGLVESAYPGDRLGVFTGREREAEGIEEGASRARRPRLQVEEASVSAFEGAAGELEECWGGDGAFKPMRRLVTLLAVVAIA